MSKIGLYVRQAWMTIKQQKLFSSIYVIGTGLSIALIMTLFVVIYVKTAPLYPEYKRDRTLDIAYVKKTLRDTTRREWSNSLASYNLYKRLNNLPHLDVIGATVNRIITSDMLSTVEVEGKQDFVFSFPLAVEDGYWRVFDFEFLRGKPFSKEDVESSAHVAVVSQSFARQLFANDDVVGRRFSIDDVEYKVCGVVRDVPSAMSNYTTSDIWVPRTVFSQTYYESDTWLGNMQLLLVAKSADDVDALKAEIQEEFRKINSQEKEYDYEVMHGPDLYVNTIFKAISDKGEFVYSTKFLYILLALIFIPALNLSGLISSKMNKRLPELGIRKTYGATNGALMYQVLWENMLLTTLGGIVGLILCVIVVFTSQDWILALFNGAFDYNVTLAGGRLSFEMLFNWQVFAFTLLLCFILNIISSMIPVAVSLRRTIIDSLNQKK